MKKKAVGLALLFATLLLTSCASGKGSSKKDCGETCRIGDKGETVWIIPMAEEAYRE